MDVGIIQDHRIDFAGSNRHYTLTVQVNSDAKLKAHNFNMFAVRDSKQFGDDFGYANFSSVTLEFTRCVTPMRRLWEESVILLSWTNPLSTLTFLCAASFVLYFSQWIMLILGVIMWTPLKKFVVGSLITVEMPNTSDYVVEEFKKNLAFIQMMEASYVDLIKSCKSMFEGVNRSGLHRAIDFLRVLPVLGLLTWIYIPQSARIAMLACFWVLVLACHPLGHQVAQLLLIRLNVFAPSEPTAGQSSAYAFVDKVAKRVASIGGSPASDLQLVKDVVVLENQRWWLGVGFVPKFIMEDTAGNETPHRDILQPIFDGRMWEWVEEWRLIIDDTTDLNGWTYAINFKSKNFTASKGILDVVRRRKWVRKCKTKVD